MLLRIKMCFVALVVALTILAFVFAEKGADAKGLTQGSLQVVEKDGTLKTLCPLKHTSVAASVSGSITRVNVSQEFTNPFSDAIEAIYVFPLPNQAAVDDMTITIGDRKVKGLIKKRDEARAIYNDAKKRGLIAALLDQERPNIFTQSVANIVPGANIKVEISYVEQLKLEDGVYEFVFPMVVGPRYIPGTLQPSDASKISPPIVPKGMRAGHDISIELSIDAGMPIGSIQSPSHDVAITQESPDQAIVTLKNQQTIPNKDFRLKLDLTGKQITDSFIVHRDDSGGYFSLMIQPPERVDVTDVLPRELIFVLDTSGSMQGFPIEKAKEAMNSALSQMNPVDSFNVITFAGDTSILFPAPVPASTANLTKARDFLAGRRGEGGTEMMSAIRAALDPSDSSDNLRIVCFMTDGYVGNEMEILNEIQKHSNARVFSFGIGESVNRFLLDGMARVGRGDVEYVSLDDDGSKAAKRFTERVRKPVLTDISLDWGGLPVEEVYPQRIPDLFSVKPVVVTGRFSGAARGSVRLSGRTRGQYFSREIPVVLPERESSNEVVAKLWARNRVESLMSEDYGGIESGKPAQEIRDAIVDLALKYRLMTKFTSFVAVDERVVTDGGVTRSVEVPIEIPERVSHAGVMGKVNGTIIPMSAPASPLTRSALMIATSPSADAAPAATDKLDPRLRRRVASGDTGTVQIEVQLGEKTPEVMDQLKRAGFVLVTEWKNSLTIVGKISIDKLDTLAGLKQVKVISLR